MPPASFTAAETNMTNHIALNTATSMSHGPCYMPSSSKFQMANDIDGKWQMVGSHALGSRNGEGRMLKNVQNSDVVQRRVPSLIIPSCCFAKKTIIAKIMPAEIMIRQMKIYSTYLAHFLISAFQTSKSLSLLTRNSIMMFSKV